MAYREDDQLNRTAYGILGLSLFLSLLGAWLAISNPQFYDRSDLKRAHARGVAGEQIPAQFRDPSTRLGGVLLSVIGLGGIGLSGALATQDPKSLYPPSIEVEGKGAGLDPQTDIKDAMDLVAECREILTIFLAENRVLSAALVARILITWGDQGAGKSLLTHQICTWRQICRRDRIIVANPHHHHDKEDGLYDTADLILGTAQKIREELPKIIADAMKITRKSDGVKNPQRITIVLEEFSKWHTSGYSLADIAELCIHIASQDTRKSVVNFILVAHGLDKGMFGGEAMESGRVSRVLDQSVVIKLEVDKSLDDQGEDPRWTGQGEISARGEAISSGKKKKFQLPAIVGPDHYPTKFAAYFRAAVLALAPPTPPTPVELLTNAVHRWQSTSSPPSPPLSHHPEPPPANLDPDSTGDSPLKNEVTLNGNFDNWKPMFQIEKAKEFCNWLLRHQINVGESIGITKLRDNWGRHHFEATEDVVTFLTLVNAYGLGSFDDHTKPKCWISKVAHTSMPPLDLMPEPIKKHVNTA